MTINDLKLHKPGDRLYCIGYNRVCLMLTIRISVISKLVFDHYGNMVSVKLKNGSYTPKELLKLGFISYPEFLREYVKICNDINKRLDEEKCSSLNNAQTIVSFTNTVKRFQRKVKTNDESLIILDINKPIQLYW